MKNLLLLAFLAISLCASSQANRCKLAAQLLLNTNGGSQNCADGLVVVFDSAFSSEVGPEDSHKFINVDENMAINRNNVLLSIEGRKPVVDNDTIPLKIWKYKHTSYCIMFQACNFPANVVAVLKDNYLHIDIPISLTDTTTIPFQLTSDSNSYSADRFCFVIKPASTLSLSTVTIGAAVKDRGIMVNWGVENELKISDYTIERLARNGQFISIGNVKSKGNNGPAAYRWSDSYPLNGDNYYRIKMNNNANEATYSAVAKVTYKGESGVTIFSNPVTDNVIKIRMTGMGEGDYNMFLYNNGGQRVLAKEIHHTESDAATSIALPTKMRAGTYLLLIQNQSHKIARQIVIP